MNIILEPSLSASFIHRRLCDKKGRLIAKSCFSSAQTYTSLSDSNAGPKWNWN